MLANSPSQTSDYVSNISFKDLEVPSTSKNSYNAFTSYLFSSTIHVLRNLSLPTIFSKFYIFPRQNKPGAL